MSVKGLGHHEDPNIASALGTSTVKSAGENGKTVFPPLNSNIQSESPKVQKTRSWVKLDPRLSTTPEMRVSVATGKHGTKRKNLNVVTNMTRVTESALFKRFGVNETKPKRNKGKTGHVVCSDYLLSEDREAFQKIYKHLTKTLAKDVDLELLRENLSVIDPNVKHKDVVKFVALCSLDEHNKIPFADLMLKCARVDHDSLQRIVARASLGLSPKQKRQFYLKAFDELQRKYIKAILEMHSKGRPGRQRETVFDPSSCGKPDVLSDMIKGECSRLVRHEEQFKLLHSKLLLESLVDATSTSPYAVPLPYVGSDRAALSETKYPHIKQMAGVSKKGKGTLKKMSAGKVYNAVKADRCMIELKGLTSKGYVKQREEFQRKLHEAYQKVKEFRLGISKKIREGIKYEGMPPRLRKRFQENTVPAYLPSREGEIFVINPWDPKQRCQVLSGKRSEVQRSNKPFR